MMREVFERDRLGVLVLPGGSWGGLHSSRAEGGAPGRNTLCSHQCNWDQSGHQQPLATSSHRNREVHILSKG